MSSPDHVGVQMRMGVWDFGGQLEYRATQRFYLSDRSLFLVVWNSRRGWRTGGQVAEWLEAIKNVAPTSPVLVVATHADSLIDIDEPGLRRRFPQIAGFSTVDCADWTGIHELRDQIAEFAAGLPLMGQRWPMSWTRAAQLLAEQPGRYITLNQCNELMAAAGIDDPHVCEIVRKAMHDRGEILYFPHDPELAETVILQPAWVDSMITRVLDSPQVRDQGGLLSRAHRAELWHDLDTGLRDMLTVLMERFDLAYRTEAPGHTDVALVVERLPTGRPAHLPPEWENALDAPGTGELRLRYKLSSRQAGIPSWFIAREHRFTTNVAWSHGVLLRHHGQHTPTLALLEDDGAAQPTVSLTVRGTTPSAIAFYSILDEGFTGILGSRYPGMPVHRLIPCPCNSPNDVPCEHDFAYSAAERAMERGIQLQCQQSFDFVDPRVLLLGIRPVPLEEAVLARLDSIGHGLDELQATTERVERSQLQALDTVRDLLGHRALQGVHCPSIFVLTKTGRTGYELALFCEQPDGPHPLDDNDGVYQLRNLPSWLRNYAPYLRMILTTLRYSIPVLGPALSGFADVTLTVADRGQLDASCKVLEAITAVPSNSDGPSFDPVFHTEQARPGDWPPRAATADFAELRSALMEIDPEFGGLRPRELPENGSIAYLCAHHRQALRYPQELPESDF